MSKHSALKRQSTNFKSNKTGSIINQNVFKETFTLLSAGTNTVVATCEVVTCHMQISETFNISPLVKNAFIANPYVLTRNGA